MFCRNCAKELHAQAMVCPGCGVHPLLERKFCQNCGSPTQPDQAACPRCSVPLAQQATVVSASGSDKKLVAGLLAIFLGSLGIHKFYLGYNTEGVIMLLLAVPAAFFTCGISLGVVHVIAIIEGILYLTRGDAEFVQTYIQGRRGWF